MEVSRDENNKIQNKALIPDPYLFNLKLFVSFYSYNVLRFKKHLGL